MKWFAVSFLAVIFLSGCSNRMEPMDEIMALREQMLEHVEVSFDAVVTADYTDKTHTFGMHCETNEQGDLSFYVTSPQTIEGITGTVSTSGGTLTFDDKVLAFEMIAEGRITPVSSPWVLMKTLRGGYIKSCADTDEGVYAVINDSYADQAFQLNILIEDTAGPVFAEILWENYRIISLEIDNFQYL